VIKDYSKDKSFFDRAKILYQFLQKNFSKKKSCKRKPRPYTLFGTGGHDCSNKEKKVEKSLNYFVITAKEKRENNIVKGFLDNERELLVK
jgi:hypothetical protein